MTRIFATPSSIWLRPVLRPFHSLPFAVRLLLRAPSFRPVLLYAQLLHRLCDRWFDWLWNEERAD
jgi:hypothetical protein